MLTYYNKINHENRLRLKLSNDHFYIKKLIIIL